MKLALFGGSFDPPHAGHVAIVRQALDTLPIDKLIVIPASKNPFKTVVKADGITRYTWLKKLFNEWQNVEISDYEVLQNRSVYTYETVCHFSEQAEDIFLIIGDDNLEKLTKWYRFEELNTMVHWVVATRLNVSIPSHMIRLDINQTISSTDFRNRFCSLGLNNPELELEILHYYKEPHERTN